MNTVLSPIAVRVVGALIEKSLATPDGYPLTLASLTTACNQKSNRDPVLNLSDSEVQEALDSLIALHMVRERNPAGARVSKFGHRFDDKLGLTFNFSRRELAVLCMLMLRGPQTPGELRTRTGRLCDFDSGAQVEQTLVALATLERGPYTMELPRLPGHRERRHAHLFSGEIDVEEFESAAAPAESSVSGSLSARVTALEATVEELMLEVMELQERIAPAAD